MATNVESTQRDLKSELNQMDSKERYDLVPIGVAAKEVGKTIPNIRYYIQYNRIKKYNKYGEILKNKAKNGELRVSLEELKAFLELVESGNGKHYHTGLNVELGFYDVPERIRTKHVHRLHPYLGKFIPQLVEWFLSKYFTDDDIILDPFMGSGTTLVQGNELRLNTVGIDISEFNCLIVRAKTQKYDIEKVRSEILSAEKRLRMFSDILIGGNDIQENLFSKGEFNKFKKELLEEIQSEYLKRWFAERTLCEMIFYRNLIKEYEYQDLLKVLLSRATRSARLVPHYDLARPKNPIVPGKVYWCRKHNKYCKPIEEILIKIHNYSLDTIRRLIEFDGIRSDKIMKIIHGDSRTVNLEKELKDAKLSGKKFNGIFTSPPYVGQIDYHDQHIYAYELFGISRNDDKEIGPEKSGKSLKAKEDYVEGIASVFINVNKYLKRDAKIFIVANDKSNLYPKIAEKSNMVIVDKFHRAVTKRTEQGDNPYQETVFYMKKKGH